MNAKERAKRKAAIHHHKPAIRIGKDGLKPETLEAIDLYLNKNEIMKIQLLPSAEMTPMEVFAVLEEKLNAEFLSVLGHVLSIYRDSPAHLYL